MVHEEDRVVAGAEPLLHVPGDEIVHIVMGVLQETVIRLITEATLEGKGGWMFCRNLTKILFKKSYKFGLKWEKLHVMPGKRP